MALVGREHNQILASIAHQWGQILADAEDVPRLITLIGPQGVGKSRILKEFYRSIASQQGQPAYWPEDIQPVGLRHNRDPLPERKALGPMAEVWPADALPDFMWWDFEAELFSSGSASPALLAGEAKLRKHEPAIWEAHLRRMGWWDRLGGPLRKAIRDLATDQSLEQLSTRLAEVGVVLPGLGFAIQRGADLMRYSQRRMRAKQALRTDVELDDGAADLALILATRVVGFSNSVPVVAVIEDAHWAEPSLCLLLEHLAKSQAKVMILATVWPEGMTSPDSQHPFAELVERLGPGLVKTINVAAPEPRERLNLISDLASANGWVLPDPVAQKLVERLSTPLKIVLAMTSSFMRDFVADGCPEDELDDMPQTLTDLYKRRWDELDRDIRDVLLLAALLSPCALTEGRSGDGRTSLALIQCSLIALQRVLPAGYATLEGEAEVADAYGAALNEVGWLITVAQAAEQFREPELAAIALERALEGLRTKHMSRVRRIYLEALEATLEDEESPARTLAAEHYMTLERVLANTEPSGKPLAVAAIVTARQQALAYEFRAAAQTLESVKERVPPGARVHVLEELAAMCHDAGLWGEASGYYHALLSCLDDDDSRTELTREQVLADLAEVDLNLKRYDDVEQMLAPVVAAQEGDLSEAGIRIRRYRANAVRGDRRRLGEAKELLEALLSDIEASRGVASMWDRQEADTRMSLSITLKRMGRHAEALTQLDDVIRLRRQIFGAEDRRTLTALGEKALNLKDIHGREAEGVQLQQQILEMREKVFGGLPHPELLKSRHTVAFALIATDPRGAARRLEGVLADKREVLGTPHLSTIITLSALARAWGEAGELSRSLELYDEAVDLKERNGSAHDALLTRRKRLRILRRLDCEEARAEAVRLVAESTSALGPFSVGTLRCRFEMALVAEHCSDSSVALALHQDVLADRREHLPLDHKDVAESEAAVRRLEGA